MKILYYFSLKNSPLLNFDFGLLYHVIVVMWMKRNKKFIIPLLFFNILIVEKILCCDKIIDSDIN